MTQPGFDAPDDESWGDLTAEPRGLDYLETELDTEAGTLPAMWAVPHLGGAVPPDPLAKAAAADRVLLCLHGGGFVSGSICTHRKMYGHLAKAAGARALIIGYRLLPEGGINPVPVDQTVAAYSWLLGQPTPPSHIAFAGDSVGAWLAVVAQLHARQRGLLLPAAAMLLSPSVDMEVTGQSFDTNSDKDPFFKRDVVLGLIRGFLGETGDPRDPLINPLYADLSGLGPLYIQAAGDEALLDDAVMLDEHARKAGVEARLDIFPGMLHTFQMAAGRAPEADEAIRELAGWVRPRLGL
jgi:acetyl esterase/lipase